MKEYAVKILDPAESETYAAQAAELYRQAGWIGSDTPDSDLIPILRNSYCVMGAWDENGDLIGMMRALSDGVSDAYLLDMIVAPAHRKQGLAHRILNELTAYLKGKGIDWIVCISVPEAKNLYAGSGNVLENHIPYRF